MNKFNKINIIVIILFSIIGLLGIFYIFYIRNNGINNGNINNIINNAINNTNEENTSYEYFTIESISNFKYNNKTKKVSNSDSSNLENKLFQTYIDNVYYGQYYLKYGTVWNLFDKNNNFINYDGKLIAFTPNMNINIYNYSENKITSEIEYEAKKMLSNYNYTYNDNYFNKVYYINDNKYIVVCTNLYDANEIENFNFIYMNDNNKKYVLINESISSSNNTILPVYYISGIFDINNKLNIAIKSVYYSSNNPKVNLYEFNGGKFTKVV